MSTFGDRVKRILGIDPEDRLDDSVYFDDGSFVESEVSTKEFLLGFVPTAGGIKQYLSELFPFLKWIFHYNFIWLAGDLIAGKSTGSEIRPSANEVQALPLALSLCLRAWPMRFLQTYPLSTVCTHRLWASSCTGHSQRPRTLQLA